MSDTQPCDFPPDCRQDGRCKNPRRLHVICAQRDHAQL